MRHAITLALAFALVAPFGGAQAQQKQQPAAKGPPPPAPAKPYTPIAFKPPTPLNDPSFEAFRKQLGEIAGKKDRAALTRLVVAQGFFWDGEKGDQADKNKSGIDNLTTAIGLAGKQQSGWEMLQGYSQDPTAVAYPGKQGVVCGPADPQFDEKALEELVKSSGTDFGDWGFPLGQAVEVRSAARANAPVSEKLGLHLIRIMPDDKAPPPAQGQAPMIRIVTPSGKVGFISGDQFSPLGNDQVCYIKEGNNWKISGFVGAGPGSQ